MSSVLCKGHFCYKFQEISLIFVCYRETPGLYRPTSVTRRSGTGVFLADARSRAVVYRDVPGHTVALPGMYERTRIPSRFVQVRPGPPATNCRDAPGRTLGQCERGFNKRGSWGTFFWFWDIKQNIIYVTFFYRIDKYLIYINSSSDTHAFYYTHATLQWSANVMDTTWVSDDDIN